MMTVGTSVTTVVCPMSGIPSDDGKCGRIHERCATCGWNPAVNRERRVALRKMAAAGKLKEWGKTA